MARIVRAISRVDRKSQPMDRVFNRTWGIYAIGMFMGLYGIPLHSISIPAFIGVMAGSACSVLLLFYSIVFIIGKEGGRYER